MEYKRNYLDIYINKIDDLLNNFSKQNANENKALNSKSDTTNKSLHKMLKKDGLKETKRKNNKNA